MCQIVSEPKLVELRKGVCFRPGKTPQDTKMNWRGMTTVKTEASLNKHGLSCTDRRRSLLFTELTIQQNKLGKLEVRSQYQQELSREVPKYSGESPNFSNSYALEFK